MKEVLLMISVDRAKRIIQCYGGRSQGWPELERQDMLQLLLDSKSLTDIQQQALVLDDVISIAEQKKEQLIDRGLDQQCADRILMSLPEQQRKIEHIAMSFLPLKLNFRANLATAILVVLVAVFVLTGLSLSNSLSLNDKSEAGRYLTMSEYMAVYVEDNYISDEQSMTVYDEQLEILAFIEPQIMSENY